jgi:hypothetical protein
MSAVEDRVRAALRERAELSPVSQDAWEKTVARTRRARGRPAISAWLAGWPKFAVPVAAAAAVVAIVAGAGLLTGRVSPHGPARSATPRPSASWNPAPPGPGNYLIQGNPPVSAIVLVKLGEGRQTTWTFLWFGYLKGHRGQGIQLCSVTEGDGYAGTGGCDDGQVTGRQVARSSGGPGDIRLGVAEEQVASVTAQLPGGHAVHGVMVSGRGFPYKVWAVRYPSADDAQVVFRDSGGRTLGHLTFAGNPPWPPRPRSGGIAVFRYPAGSGHARPGWMFAYLMGGSSGAWSGKVGFWSSDGVDSSISAARASGPPAVGLMGGDYRAGAKQAEFYGYAHENVARVVLRLADGKQYSAWTFAAWPGSGLRLWAFPVQVSALPSRPRTAVMEGYDAAGRLVWHMPLGG